jgi:hypothetical protein
MAGTDDFDSAPDFADFDAAPDAPAPKPVKKPERTTMQGLERLAEYVKARLSGDAEPSAAVGTLPGVRTIQTPTGPTHLDAEGRPVLTPEEAAQMQAANAARFKERGLEAALSTLSGGGTMLDEIAGANAVAYGGPAAREGEGLGDRYVRTRDSARRDVARATRNASPTVQVGGADMPVLPMIGAAIPSLLAPNPAGVLSRVLGGGATAALDQVGRSEADLTKGEVGDFAKDVGGAGGTGLAVSGVAEGITAPLRAFGRGATNQAALAKEAVTDAVQAAKDQAAKSAESAIGGIASGQGNSAETVADIIRNPHLYDVPTVDAAHRFVNSPEGKLMMNRAAMNNLEKLAKSAPREEAARLAAAEAQSAAAPAAVAQEVAQKLEPAVVAGDLGKKFMRSVGQRAALSAGGAAAGAGLSELTGGDWRTGGAIGAGSGWATPGVLQFARNQMSSPVVQHAGNSLIAKILRGTSNAAGGAARAAGPEANVTRETKRKAEVDSTTAALLRALRGGELSDER